jgi:hypothetical protein
LKSLADRQDYRPDKQHWPFREIAGQLEACQVECVLVRIRQIAANARPTFELYDNDGWDFSDRHLGISVRAFNERSRPGSLRTRMFAAWPDPEQEAADLSVSQ